LVTRLQVINDTQIERHRIAAVKLCDSIVTSEHTKARTLFDSWCEEELPVSVTVDQGDDDDCKDDDEKTNTKEDKATASSTAIQAQANNLLADAVAAISVIVTRYVGQDEVVKQEYSGFTAAADERWRELVSLKELMNDNMLQDQRVTELEKDAQQAREMAKEYATIVEQAKEKEAEQARAMLQLGEEKDRIAVEIEDALSAKEQAAAEAEAAQQEK
jgi:hypothetical protein